MQPYRTFQRYPSLRLLSLAMSLIVVLKVRVPENHPAHPEYMTTSMLTRRRRRIGRPGEVAQTDNLHGGSSSNLNRSGGALQGLAAAASSAQSGPPLPTALKASILAKHAEWLEANKTGRADWSDPIEEELEALERQALDLNAAAFRLWREQNYENEEIEKCGTYLGAGEL
ncbi:hypothetical protein OPT61_g4104 [Boeremia exigua]|uniref:Uncharacterized protein n=1 Tax=Boeremia exigua TaxID=749465 RepID=A0ACC2IFA5_9PLEO|nr:hypothetical protein OPT61_g4104 [Boeremia exigua]